MARDMISALPDEMLLRVLSFLPTKQVVATSVLSKRWRFLWHSVSSFDFDFDFDGHTPLNLSKEAYLGFVQSVCKVLNSGDTHRPIQRFRLRCNSPFYDATDFNTFINVAVRRRVEHLDFSLLSSERVALSIPTCTTLVSLKLENLHLNVPSSINFPSLKILHLNRVDFPEHAHLAELLSGSPTIEDFTVKYLSFRDFSKEKPYKSFTKLVKACIISSDITFEAFKYSKFLRIDWAMLNSEELIPLFPNLTHLQYVYAFERNELVFKMLKHSPKLQFLSIDKDDRGTYVSKMELTYPESVPDCISSQLRTCCFNCYVGSESEFQLAVYIMENATRLQSMTIHTKPSFKEPEKLLLRFSMCIKRSSSCKLLMYGTPSGGGN